MVSSKKLGCYLVAVLAVIHSVGASADDQSHGHDHGEHDHSHDHGAHVHGIGELTLAFEGALSSLEFIIPADSVVGFEHKATTEKEISAVKKAIKLLSGTSSVVSFEGTRCELVESQVDTGGLLTKQHSHHDSEHGHAHSHHDSKEHGNGHFEFHVTQDFKCQAPQKLKSVSVNVFNHFQSIEKIKTMWISDQTQGAAELEPAKRRINFN